MYNIELMATISFVPFLFLINICKSELDNLEKDLVSPRWRPQKNVQMDDLLDRKVDFSDSNVSEEEPEQLESCRSILSLFIKGLIEYGLKKTHLICDPKSFAAIHESQLNYFLTKVGRKYFINQERFQILMKKIFYLFCKTFRKKQLTHLIGSKDVFAYNLLSTHYLHFQQFAHLVD